MQHIQVWVPKLIADFLEKNAGQLIDKMEIKGKKKRTERQESIHFRLWTNYTPFSRRTAGARHVNQLLLPGRSTNHQPCDDGQQTNHSLHDYSRILVQPLHEIKVNVLQNELYLLVVNWQHLLFHVSVKLLS